MKLLLELLNSCTTFSEFVTKIQSYHNIKLKVCENTNRALLYTDFSFDINKLKDLEKECRSVVIDRETLKIICYTYTEYYYNDQAYDELQNKTITDIFESIEGTLLSFYYYNDNWLISTRKLLDIHIKYYFNKKSYFELLSEICNFGDICSLLDKTKKYYFVLVHNENKHIIDYSTKYNDTNYKMLYHVLTRDENNNIDYQLQELDAPYIKYPTKLNTLDQIPDSEGLIVVCDDGTICKLQSDKVKKLINIKPNYGNDYVNYLEMYQQNTLSDYLKDNNITDNIILDIEMLYHNYSLELYTIYKLFWNLKTGNAFVNDSYNHLNKEYKTLFYHLRGVYYKCKHNNVLFTYQKIEEYLKTYSVVELTKVLLTRNYINNYFGFNNNKNVSYFIQKLI